MKKASLSVGLVPLVSNGIFDEVVAYHSVAEIGSMICCLKRFFLAPSRSLSWPGTSKAVASSRSTQLAPPSPVLREARSSAPVGTHLLRVARTTRQLRTQSGNHDTMRSSVQ